MRTNLVDHVALIKLLHAEKRGIISRESQRGRAISFSVKQTSAFRQIMTQVNRRSFFLFNFKLFEPFHLFVPLKLTTCIDYAPIKRILL